VVLLNSNQSVFFYSGPMEFWTTGCLLPLHYKWWAWRGMKVQMTLPVWRVFVSVTESIILPVVWVPLSSSPGISWASLETCVKQLIPWLALQGDWRIRVLGWVTSLKFQYQFWLRSYKSHKTMLCTSTGNSPTNWKRKMKIHPIRWMDARLMKVGLNKNFKTLKLIQELHLLEGLALLQLQRASSSTLLTTWTLFARVQDLIDCLKIYSEKTTLESVKFCY